MIKRISYNSKTADSVYRYIDSINNVDLSVSPDIIKIIKDVQKNKDDALKRYEKKFDNVNIKCFKVKQNIVKKAYDLIDKKVLSAMKIAIKNIKAYHKLQKKNLKNFVYRNNGYEIKQTYLPIYSAGIYIPAGQAPLFSTVFMAVIPAKVAGVKKIVLVSPPRYNGEINPYILVAADMLDIRDIYRVGGAHAIAALAYGTQSIPKVDKIVGPGNIYSTKAKKYLFGNVGIDCINGPSEITIIADETAEPDYIFYDLLAQAEHSNGHSFLITTSKQLAQIVENKLKNNFKQNKQNIIIIQVKKIVDAITIANYKAPEHLLVITKKPNKIIKKIKNAPAIFIGNNTPVAFGDYIAGGNHILPTNGTARFFSALSVLDFMKHTHIVKCTKNAIKKFGPFAELMAKTEKLYNHGKSLEIRRTNYVASK